MDTENTGASKQEPLLHTVEDVARLLSLSDTKVRRMIWAGHIPSVRIGRAVRVTDEALREFVRGLAK